MEGALVFDSITIERNGSFMGVIGKQSVDSRNHIDNVTADNVQIARLAVNMKT